MRPLVALFGVSLCCVASVSHAGSPVDIGAGVELSTWQEFANYGGENLKESGARLFVSLEKENEVSERWVYGFRGRLYSGSVSSSGVLKDGSACLNESDYDGVSGSIDFTGRFLRSTGDYSDWGLRVGVGGEGWRHHLSGLNDYTERYTVFFGRLGVALLAQQGWFGEAGLKYPFAVRENVELYDGARLTPQGAFSLFTSVGYNFAQRWSLRAYYDSYRFKASDPEVLATGGISVGSIQQGKSDMHILGAAIGLYF